MIVAKEINLSWFAVIGFLIITWGVGGGLAIPFFTNEYKNFASYAVLYVLSIFPVLTGLYVLIWKITSGRPRTSSLNGSIKAFWYERVYMVFVFPAILIIYIIMEKMVISFIWAKAPLIAWLILGLPLIVMVLMFSQVLKIGISVIFTGHYYKE